MTWTPLDTGNRWAVLGVTVFLMGCLGALAKCTPALALINESPSLPRGLYTRIGDARPTVGAIVATHQPERARAYLARIGMPPQVLLIKRIAAQGGDRVCRTGDVVATPGRRVRVLGRDRSGIDLPSWQGCRTLEEGEVFLLGDTPSSFDSRYFGPVTVREVRGVYRESLTW
jgi:type IV secretory pathway protease TraF